MECKDAILVYTQEDIIAGIESAKPGVMKYLEKEVLDFVQGVSDSFDSAVKDLVSANLSGFFRLTHRDDDSELSKGVHDVLGDDTSRKFFNAYFSEKYGRSIFLGNICCSGCIVADHDLSLEESLPIQRAAISLQPKVQ